MVLRTLEMQGFKSFPDKTELKFGKGITAVVGPNGSGKSNISDGVRWVLGEQKTKSLRGTKMEDVIFGGTSTRRPLGFAQITLTLDNSDKTLKDKGELVSVTRRYYRSGESEYKIDGELVRRKDVRELFMDTGLGADGYSLVSQGKIESIIEKKEDRREIFEEAAGISKFRAKRTDAIRRLEQAQENLVRLLDILQEIEGRVEPLRIQSEKATQFLVFAEEKKELEIGLWLHRINKFTQELREQQRKIAGMTESYNSSEKELKNIETEIEEVINQTSQISVEIDEIRRGGTGFEEEALRNDAEVQVLENNILHNDETIRRISREMSEVSGESTTIDTQIEEKQALIEEKQQLIDKKKSELEQEVLCNEKIQSENQQSSERSVQVSRALSEFTMQISDCKVKVSQAFSSIEEIKSRQGTVDSAIQQGEAVIKALKGQKSESEENIKFLNSRIEEYTNTLSGCQIRVQQKTSKSEQTKVEMDKLFMSIQQKSSRAKMLSDLEKNMEGYSGAVKLVMKQAKGSSLTGILGPVSQLIAVEPQYSVAVETALGGAMQNIVTENETDAKRAILFLKQNKAGRATFLPVSAIKGRALNEKNLEDNIGFVDLATSLVKCDEKYQQIISSLLGKTVVCEDMDSAIGMAKKYSYRFRIVTLDGQVINAGGSMTGGSRTQNAGILSRGNQIEQLEKEVKEGEKSLDEKKALMKAANEELSKAKADLDGAGADLANANEDKIRAEGEDKLIFEQLQSAEKNMQSLLEEQSNAKGRIQLLKLAGNKAQEEVDRLTAEMEKAQKELEELSGNAEELAKKREETNEKISSINLEIITSVNDQENAKIIIQELKARKNSQSGRVDLIKNEIDEINEKNVQIRATIEEIKKSAKALREKAKASNENIESLVEKRNDFEKRSGELRLAERAKTADREKLSTELGRLEERCQSMTTDYENTINKLYDEYQLTKAEAEEVGSDISDISAATRRLNELKSSIRSLGSVNVSAIEEYKEVSERYTFLKGQIDDVEKSRKELTKIIDELTSSMGDKFRIQFHKINDEFKTTFADFFGGGNGELVLDDMENVLESPIEIKIQPPGKSVQNISLFSGGEKTLAALALLFSILKVSPSPFCIYDEVEAALDDVNVERFARYMRRMTDKTQFISITHRRGTMEEADILYGVTMQEKGVSKLLELQTAEMAKTLGID